MVGMIESLVRRLEYFTPLNNDEKAALAGACLSLNNYAPEQDVVRQGEIPEGVSLIVKGICSRYRTIEDGRRQTLAFSIAGDFCDLHGFILGRMDYSIAAITKAKVALMSNDKLDAAINTYPRLGRALAWAALASDAITREWVVNLGRRTAYEAMAHLFCELYHRQKAIGLARGLSCDLPMTQIQLGEALGITTVHINRVLKELRGAGLLTLSKGVLTIHDLQDLEKAAVFDADYLHLSRPQGRSWKDAGQGQAMASG
jgi:CRP-like cAMP-binding protein